MNTGMHARRIHGASDYTSELPAQEETLSSLGVENGELSLLADRIAALEAIVENLQRGRNIQP